MQFIGKTAARLAATAQLIARPRERLPFAIKHRFHIECFDRYGRLKWEDITHNLVVNVGLDEILQRVYKSSAFTATDYVGLLDDTPTIAATDTMASHAGWVEAVPYSEAVRQTFTPGTVASQSVDNSASKATYSINATDTVGGCFLSDNNTKSGTAGILIGAAAFSGGDKAVANLDTLNVTLTATAASP